MALKVGNGLDLQGQRIINVGSSVQDHDAITRHDLETAIADAFKDIEIQATVDGQQIISAVGITSKAVLLINGLRQRRGSYTISPNTVTVPVDLNVMAGDILTIVY